MSHSARQHQRDLGVGLAAGGERAQAAAALGVGRGEQQRRGDQHADRVADPEAQPAG